MLFHVGQVFVLSAGTSTMLTNLAFPRFSGHFKDICQASVL